MNKIEEILNIYKGTKEYTKLLQELRDKCDSELVNIKNKEDSKRSAEILREEFEDNIEIYNLFDRFKILKNIYEEDDTDCPTVSRIIKVVIGKITFNIEYNTYGHKRGKQVIEFIDISIKYNKIYCELLNKDNKIGYTNPKLVSIFDMHKFAETTKEQFINFINTIIDLFFEDFI